MLSRLFFTNFTKKSFIRRKTVSFKVVVFFTYPCFAEIFCNGLCLRLTAKICLFLLADYNVFVTLRFAKNVYRLYR